MTRPLLSILVIVALSLTACAPTSGPSAEAPPGFIKGIWMPVPFNAFSYGFDT